MARHRNSSSKNFGFGNRPEYATKVALNEHFRDGHHGTVKSHIERSKLFYDWLDEEYKIRDIRLITDSHLSEYVLYLKLLMNEEEIAVPTATNRISSVNVVLQIIRGDQKIRIPKVSEALEKKRCYIRRSIPDGMDFSKRRFAR